MIRIVVENLVLFFLPLAIYVTYVLLTRKEGTKGGLLDEAPILWLGFAGTLLVIVVLIAFGSSSGGKPGQVYVPPTMKDGKVQPGTLK